MYGISDVVELILVPDYIWATARQNQQFDLYARRSLISAGHSPSQISLRCPHKETLVRWPHIERTAKTLIRLGGCPGWFESSLGVHVILFVLSCSGSYFHWFHLSIKTIILNEYAKFRSFVNFIDINININYKSYVWQCTQRKFEYKLF